jgi:hypothetical protein
MSILGVAATILQHRRPVIQTALPCLSFNHFVKLLEVVRFATVFGQRLL